MTIFEEPFCVRTLAATFYDGHHIEPHRHPWGQLIYAEEGVMRVHVDDRVWVVPPARAVWAPPSALHEIWAVGTFKMRTLYLAPGLAALLARACGAVEVSPLLRELVLRVVTLGMLKGVDEAHRHLIDVMLDELRTTPALPLSIRMPVDRRARVLAARLQRDPSDKTDLDALAKEAGASTRTLQRLFHAETGLRFAQWRQRLRLLQAVTSLGTGASVTDAGHAAGYSSTSAFIAAFRKELGQTPMRYRAAPSSGSITA